MPCILAGCSICYIKQFVGEITIKKHGVHCPVFSPPKLRSCVTVLGWLGPLGCMHMKEV
jgi:hypothetical protein